MADEFNSQSTKQPVQWMPVPENAETIHFHETLIRLAKGMISAWEKWLEVQKQKT